MAEPVEPSKLETGDSKKKAVAVHFQEENKERQRDSRISEAGNSSSNFPLSKEENKDEDFDEPVPRTSFSETRLPQRQDKAGLSTTKRAATFSLAALNALGVVYGDIGTSPLYVFATIFANEEPTPDRVKGALSLIIYSLTFVVVIKYLIFVMMADFRGEGGIFALTSLLLHNSDKDSQPQSKHYLLGVRDYLPDKIKKKKNPLKKLGGKRAARNKNEEADLPKSDDDESLSNKRMSVKVEEVEIELGKDAHVEPTASMQKLKRSRFLKKSQVKTFYATLALVGAGLLMGDGVITPAISVLSALEGLQLLGDSVTPAVVPVTCIILLGLFMMQQLGTAKVGLCFGPIMLLWFFSIGGLGLAKIVVHPAALEAFNPYWIGHFFVEDSTKGWTLLGSVMLAVTGCEAMYADMGHFGKNPIRISWLFYVYPALLLNYVGQGSLLIEDPTKISNPFYELLPGPLYFPMLILATLATIIASQALISGAFSVAQQAISLGCFPRLKIVHTSSSVEGQIYIPTLNYTLMIVCIILVVAFRSSAALSSAYGLAVCGDMIMTTFMFASVSRLRWKWNIFGWTPLIIIFFFVDIMFLSSALLKIPTGGYVPLIIASVSFVIMYTWKRGKETLNEKTKEKLIPWEELEKSLKSKQIKRCKGKAIFMASLTDGVPTSLTDLVTHVPFLHKTVIFMTIEFKHVPNVQHVFIERLPVKGFYRVIAQFGYRASKVSMKNIFERCNYILPELELDLDNCSFFLGKEHVRADKNRWFGHRYFVKAFSMMLQICYTAAASFKIPNKNLVFMGHEQIM